MESDMSIESQPEQSHFEAYWPRAAARGKAKPLAPRLPTLAGKRVAFLWDFLFRGDDIYAIVEEELRKRFDGISFMGWQEIGNIHGGDERKIVAGLPARLRAGGVDAVITSVAA
jgi:hypothetical protein